MTKDYKKLCTGLKRSLSSKIVLREGMNGKLGHKLKSVDLKYLGDGWYWFKLDGYEFECKWKGNSSYRSKEENYKSVWYTFRNSNTLSELAKSVGKHSGRHEGSIQGEYIRYSSSRHFGYANGIIRVLWVFGEVLGQKDYLDYE
jgi:hypothetical protein